jgi:hypothetical protein
MNRIRIIELDELTFKFSSLLAADQVGVHGHATYTDHRHFHSAFHSSATKAFKASDQRTDTKRGAKKK